MKFGCKMSTRIKQLAKMFEKIVYEYYGEPGKVLDEKGVMLSDEDCADLKSYEYLHSKDRNIEEHIEASAQAKNTTPDRASLMKHLAHGIALINVLLDDPTPLTKAIVISIKQNLTDLLIDLKKLLNLPKADYITIKYGDNDIEVKIYGCLLCRSGKIIQRTLSSVLMKTSEEIAEYITDIVNAHQYPLLLDECVRLQSENKSYELVIMKQLSEIEEMRKDASGKKTNKAPGSFHPTYSIFQAIVESAAAILPELDESESSKKWHNNELDPWA